MTIFRIKFSLSEFRIIFFDIFTKRISYYNYLLLNSDGLSDYVRNHEIETLMNQSTSLNELGEALIQAALDHQSKDNVSVLLAEIEGNNV